MYNSTLRYVISMAVNNIFNKNNIRFSNSINMSLFAKLVNRSISEEEMNLLYNETKRIISLDLKIVRKRYSIEEMEEYYKNLNYIDKINNLKLRKESVNIYECNGYRNYMYSYMLPSTGYLKEFEFIYYYPGFIIQYPRSEKEGNIPEFKDEPRFLNCLANAKDWAAITNSLNIYDINEQVNDREKLIKYINLCETKHNHDLCEIGSIIERNIQDIRLVAIAGPSSSGKTTFSKRLEIEMLSRNIKPLRISLDNYYLPREQIPLDENGNYDFEHINGLNLKLFNNNMTDFLDGKEVSLPIYDFKSQVTKFSEPIKLDKNGVIIIEGIHALNNQLTASIPHKNVFKIYIAPLAQRSIDNHNPISITETRLLRRLVRDKQFRNTSALDTLNQWKSVRDGERKWIYPYMENADYIFNSDLGYEQLALKKYAEEELKKIPNDSEQYINANRLLKFLKLYNNIDEDLIPNNSLIREFIGGSVFED